MSCTADYASQLRARGFRMTPQRQAILHVLRHAGTHLTPGEVYRLARQEFPRITEPTVYRTLEFLARIGLVRPSHTGNGHFAYQIAGDEHHHLVCRICGGETEVQHGLLESLFRTLESISGYVRIDSHMTFIGICPNCATA